MSIGKYTIAACFVFALCLTVSAQVGQTRDAMLPGKFTGKIVDPPGLYIPGATITVTARGFRRQFWSGADGIYFKQLPPGTYDVRISHPGFLLFRKRIRIDPGGVATLDVALQLNPRLFYKTVIVTRRG